MIIARYTILVLLLGRQPITRFPRPRHHPLGLLLLRLWATLPRQHNRLQFHRHRRCTLPCKLDPPPPPSSPAHQTPSPLNLLQTFPKTQLTNPPSPITRTSPTPSRKASSPPAAVLVPSPPPPPHPPPAPPTSSACPPTSDTRATSSPPYSSSSSGSASVSHRSGP